MVHSTTKLKFLCNKNYLPYEYIVDRSVFGRLTVMVDTGSIFVIPEWVRRVVSFPLELPDVLSTIRLPLVT